MHTGSTGTPGFAAPELLTAGKLTKAADIYSLALISEPTAASAAAAAAAAALGLVQLPTQLATSSRLALGNACMPRSVHFLAAGQRISPLLIPSIRPLCSVEPRSSGLPPRRLQPAVHHLSSGAPALPADHPRGLPSRPGRAHAALLGARGGGAVRDTRGGVCVCWWGRDGRYCVAHNPSPARIACGRALPCPVFFQPASATIHAAAVCLPLHVRRPTAAEVVCELRALLRAHARGPPAPPASPGQAMTT